MDLPRVEPLSIGSESPEPPEFPPTLPEALYDLPAQLPKLRVIIWFSLSRAAHELLTKGPEDPDHTTQEETQYAF